MIIIISIMVAVIVAALLPSNTLAKSPRHTALKHAAAVVVLATSTPWAWGNIATGGTITTVGSYEVHTFTSSGTLTPLSPLTGVWSVIVGGGGGGGEGDQPILFLGDNQWKQFSRRSS